MKEKAYKIALNHINSFIDKKETLHNILKEVEKGNIKTDNEFLSILEEQDISKKEFVDIVTETIEKKESEKIVDYALLLGKKGLGLIADSWFKRNLPDEILKKVIPQKNWELFRDKNWIEKNKLI